MPYKPSSNSNVQKPIVVTSGEPAGIGPDIIVQLAKHRFARPWIVLADPTLLASRAKLLNKTVDIVLWQPGERIPAVSSNAILVWPQSLGVPSKAGVLNQHNVPYVLTQLEAAIRGCMRGEFSAMVTGPVHKGLINEAGISFTGQTEYLANATDTPKVVMMLLGGTLRVALATTHLPLSQVPAAITKESLYHSIKILHQALKSDFAIPAPNILVCGLNPHAGENGHMGREEIEIIIPVLEQLRGEGVKLTGPLPADTLFVPQHLKQADAVFAMYHDQGLPVLKSRYFGQAVNMTLGLPFHRVSVDHGTALDIAGAGSADSGSLLAALKLANQLS